MLNKHCILKNNVTFALNVKYQLVMKKKFREALAVVCKDMGLTEKAIDELVDLGSKSLKDDADDDAIRAAVDSLVPYAKLMQGEITRKTRKTENRKQSTDPSVDEGKGEGNTKDEIPDWFKEQMKSINESLTSLKAENDTLKAEKNSQTRASLIQKKAKERNIPDYLMKYVHIADDADIDASLDEMKQDLVTNSLLPKEALSKGDIEAQMKAEAEAWANTLPNK